MEEPSGTSVTRYFKIPPWNYNSITIIQQHLNIYVYKLIQLRASDFVDLGCDGSDHRLTAQIYIYQVRGLQS